MANKKLNLTELIAGGTGLDDGVAAIHRPPRIVVADATTDSTDNTIMVSVLNAAGASPARTITIANSDRLIDGYTVTIKDVTGICSSSQAIAIMREDEVAIEGNVITTISAPYGSLTLQSNGTDMFIVPSRDSQLFSPPTTFTRELALNGATENREFLILPTDPTLPDNITLFYNKTNAYPYVVCSGAGTATISRMVGQVWTLQDDAKVRPTAGTLAVASTPVYFSKDGTSTTAIGLSDLNSYASFRFRIEGFGTSLMTPQIVVMNFLSGGLDTTQPLMSIGGDVVPASYFEID